MPRPLGTPKTGGRKKGTLNRKTETLLEALEGINLNVPGRLIELLALLTHEKQADVLLELMCYLYPKKKAVEHSGLSGGSIHLNTDRVDFASILKTNPETVNVFLEVERIVRNAK